MRTSPEVVWTKEILLTLFESAALCGGTARIARFRSPVRGQESRRPKPSHARPALRQRVQDGMVRSHRTRRATQKGFLSRSVPRKALFWFLAGLTLAYSTPSLRCLHCFTACERRVIWPISSGWGGYRWCMPSTVRQKARTAKAR